MAAERDVKEFRFQLLCKVKVCDKWQGQSSPRSQLLACSSKYGLTFTGCPTGFKVFKTSDISQKDAQHPKDKTTVIINDCPVWMTVTTQQAPCYLALNCDDQLLMVVVRVGTTLSGLFYRIDTFGQQGGAAVPVIQAQLDGSGLTIVDEAWNPTVPALLALCLSDGSVALLNVTDKVSVTAKLPSATQATCLCWSPKGKQLVVGKDNGTFSQYDQALTEKKRGPLPNCLPSQRFKMIDILWESTFMFIGTFLSLDADSSEQPQVVMINTPKESPPTFSNLDDPCYGSGEDSHHKLYKTAIPKCTSGKVVLETFREYEMWPDGTSGPWFIFKALRNSLQFQLPREMILLASASSSSLGILGRTLEVKNSAWEKWNLDDNARAELPLDEDYSDTFPVGMAIDYSSQMTLTMPDKSTQPPCPILMLFTTDGLLVPFYMIYSLPNAPGLTSPPEPLPGGITLPGALTPTVPPFVAAAATATPPSTGFNFGGAASPMPSTTLEPRQPNIPPGPSLQPTGLFKVANQNTATVSSANQATSTIPANPMASPGQGSSPFSFGQSNQSSSSITFGQSGPSFRFVTKPQVDSASTPALAPASVKPMPVATATSIGQSQLVTSLTPGSSGTKAAIGQMPPASVATPTNFVQSANQTIPVPQPVPVGQRVSQAPPPQYTRTQAGQAAAARLSQSLAGSFQQEQQSAASVNQQGPSAVSSEPAANQNNEIINRAVDSEFTQSLLEELAHFEKEVHELRGRARDMNIQIGAPQEKEQLTRATNTMCKFVEDVRENTENQLSEINDLKAQTLDMFASVEQCRMRLQRNKDQHYHHLLQARTLDPSSAQKKRSLEQQFQSVENTVRDVELVLDHQWDEYQEQKKTKKRSIQIPRSDLLYRTVKGNQSVINAQLQKIEVMKTALKRLQLYNSTTPWDSSNSHLNGKSSVIEREIDLTSLTVSGIDQSPAATSSKPPSLSPERVANLREFLCRRSVSKVKSTRPANWLMSKIVSAAAIKGRLNASTSENTERGPGQAVTTPRSSRTEKALQPRTLSQSVSQQNGLSGEASSVVSTQNRVAQVPAAVANPVPLFGQPQPSQKMMTPQNPLMSVSAVSVCSSSSSLLFGAGTQSASETTLKKVPEAGDMPNLSPPIDIGRDRNCRPDMDSPAVSDSDNGEYLPGYGVGDGDGPTYQDLSNEEEEIGTEDDAADPDILESNSESELPPGTSSSLPKPFNFSRGGQPPNQTAPGAFFMAGSESSDATSKTHLDAISTSGKTATFGTASFSFSGQPTPQMIAVAAKSAGKPTPQMLAVAAKSTGTNANTTTSQSGPQGDKESNPMSQSTTGFSFGSGGSDGASAFGGQGGLTSKGFTGLFGKSQGQVNPTSDTISSAASSFSALSSAAASSRQSVESKSEDTSTQPQTKFGGQPSGFSFGGLGSSSGFTFGQTTFGAKTADTSQPAEGVTADTSSSVAKTSKEDEIKAASSTEGSQAKAKVKLFGAGTATANSGENLFSGITSTTSTSGASASGFGTAATTTSAGLFGSGTAASTTSAGLFGSGTAVTTTGAGLFGSGTAASTTSAGLFGSGTAVTTTGAGLFGSGTAATTSSAGLFGSGTAVTTTSAGLFGSGTAASTTSAGLFGSGTPASTTSAGLFGSGTAATTSSAGLFGSGTAVTTNSAGLFGSGTAVTSTSGASASGFGTAATTTSADLFGSGTAATTTSAGLFGTGTAATTTSAGLPGFGTAAPTTSAGLFGSETSTTAANTGLPGSSTTATTADGGILGSGTTTTSALSGSSTTSATTSGVLFGNGTTITTPAGGLFGNSTTTTTPAGGLFGNSSTAPTPGGGLFGSSTSATTAGGGLFGNSTTASTAGGDLFGNSTTATTAGGGLFGSSTTATTAGGGLFGNSTTATTAGGGLFGNSTTATTTSGGLFGNSTTVTTAGGGLFGNSTTATTAGGGLFGNSTSASTTTGGLFGSSTSATTTGGGLFGSNTSSTGGGLFGSNNQASGGVFGSTSSSAPVFGSTTGTTAGGGLFGQSTATNGAGGFGSATTSSGAFGSSTTGGSAAGFGGSSGGGFLGGLGGKPSAENASKNVFGSPTFGSPATNPSNANLFGNQGATGFGSTFGTSSTAMSGGFGNGGANPATGGFGSASAFGTSGTNVASAGFGSPGGNVAASGFGVTSPTQQASFGGSPVFGSNPQFGGSPAFGSAPGFGSSPVFGGPKPVFGSSTFGGSPAPAAGAGGGLFGSPQPSSGGFAQMANSASPTFGSLAHSTGSAGFGSPGFGGGSPNPSGGFGGQSFGSSQAFTGYRS